MKRKKKPEEHVNHERWLVSYADYVTLLFAFFTAMYAISQVDAKKLATFAASVQSALNNKVTVQQMKEESVSVLDGKAALFAPIASDPTGDLARERARMESLKDELDKRLQKSRFKKSMNIIADKRGVTITIKDTILFDSGSAIIRPEVLPALSEIASVIKKVGNQIRVEGHTDNTPISNDTFRSNWELSTARATSIIQYFLTSSRFAPQQLSAAGYAEYRPVKPNDTPENRAANRRVDIVVLNSQMETCEPASSSQTLGLTTPAKR